MGKSARQQQAARARREAREFEMGYVGPEEAASEGDVEEGDSRRVLVNPRDISDGEETKEEEEEQTNEMTGPFQEMTEAAGPFQETTGAAGSVVEATGAAPR